jgi:hypothetical protein
MTNKVDAIATGLLVARTAEQASTAGKNYQNKLMLSKAEFGIAMRPKQPELVSLGQRVRVRPCNRAASSTPSQ